MVLWKAAVLASLLAATSATAELCRIQQTDILQQHETTGEWMDVAFTECNPVGTKLFYELEFAADSDHEHHEHGASQFLEYDPAWIHTETQKMTVPSSAGDLVFYTADEVLQRMMNSANKDNNNNDHNQQQQHQQQQRLMQTRNVTDEIKGVMIVARVTTADETVNNDVNDIAGYVFDTPDTSFKDVHAACSFNKQVVTPYDENEPVIDLELADANITGFTFGSFYEAVRPLLEDYLAVDNLEDVAEFILLVSPNGLRPTMQTPNFRFVAAGAYNSWKSVVTDDWIDTPQVLQHVIGHNYGLGHPWENDRIYGDSTSVMGQVYRGLTYNCYNGLAYDYLGWMDDRTLELEIAAGDEPVAIDLAFFGDYNIPDEQLAPTLIKANGFYILYNRKDGINADTNEYGDAVLLHRYKQEGNIATGSDLAGVVDVSAEKRQYRSEVYGLAVEFCSATEGDGETVPDLVSLVFGPYDAETLCDNEGVTALPTVTPPPAVSPPPTVSLPPAISPPPAGGSPPPTDGGEVNVTGTLAGLVSERDDMVTLTSAVVAADLVEPLATQGPLTLFAPVDDAFDNVDPDFLARLLEPEWILHLQDLLIFHVTTAGAVMSSDLADGMMIEMLNTQNVTVNIDGDDEVTLTSRFTEGAAVTETDFNATNGVMHILGDVLLPNSVGMDLFMLVNETEGFSILASLLADLGVLDLLEEDSSYTVIAPTDDAFSALPAETIDFLQDPENADEVREVLLYHIIEGVYPSVLIEPGTGTIPTLQGNAVTYTKTEDGEVTFNDVLVIGADQLANNGIAHVVGEVLLPIRNGTEPPPQNGTEIPSTEPPTESGPPSTIGPSLSPAPSTEPPALPPAAIPPPTDGSLLPTMSLPPTDSSLPTTISPPTGDIGEGTLVDVVADRADMSTLASAVVAAGLDGEGALAGEGPFTLFAPLDSAFDNLDPDYLARLLEPEWTMHLQDLLIFHVTANGDFPSTELTDGMTLLMQNEENVTVNIDSDDGTVTISSTHTEAAVVTEADIAATNGVMHVVDGVLLPNSAGRNLAMLVNETEGLAILASLLDGSGVLDELDEGTFYTVLAPIDDAFGALPAETSDFLQDPENVDVLREVLLYHIIEGVYPSFRLAPSEPGELTTLQGSTVSYTVSDGDESEVTFNEVAVIGKDVLVNDGIAHVMGSVLLPPDVTIPLPSDGSPSPVDSPGTTDPSMAPTEEGRRLRAI